MRVPLSYALAALVGVSASAHARVVRQEVLSFHSVTLSDTEFLNAKQNGFDEGRASIAHTNDPTATENARLEPVACDHRPCGSAQNGRLGSSEAALLSSFQKQ